ncbi:MAG: class I SAM-dependent methyltransferase [Saprospiraceae bacterium]|nr:class I SAM-dependent methyltransferase [Saprospiraceae bacterium]
MTKENILKTYFELIENPRNIYQNAQLYEQNRFNSEEIKPFLRLSDADIEAKMTKSNVLDYRPDAVKTEEWESQNKRFMNYHRSLTPFTLINGLPFNHYLGIKTGLAYAENKVVLDVGGGTGQTFVNFFQYPHKLTYFLIDPNLRLLHDQFIRIYPQLLTLKMGHILGFGEKLPFKDSSADIVLCFAAIDHMADYKQFLVESKRVLKEKGQILITGHIDAPMTKRASRFLGQLFSATFFEFLARKMHQLTNRVAIDDHTVHFDNTQVIENELKNLGFRIEQSEIIKGRQFYILAQK